MAPVHKIALIQLNPVPLDCETNFKRASDFIREAAAQGAVLAVLPEYHLTNWVPDDPNFIAVCTPWQSYLQRYQDLARELSINIVPGTIVEHHPSASDSADVLANAAYFISLTGTVLNRYQKKNLWHPERPHLTSSGDDAHEVFDTPLGLRAGMLVCWDLAFPEAFRELVAQGAQLIIVPTFWTLTDCSPFGLGLNPRSEALFLQSALVTRAFENTCAVIFVNAGEAANVGEEGKGFYAGLSQLAVPFVGALGDETKASPKEGMSVVELDVQILEEAEKQYKVREDIKREDWHYVYRHALPDGQEGKGSVNG